MKILLPYGLKNLFIILLILSFCSTAQSQDNISFHHLTVENGLSQNSVLSITQDAQGYIWLGTRFGLNKYDTNKIKIFKHSDQDSTTLSSSDYIRVLFSDQEKTLWVGTSGGLNKYHPETENFERIEHSPARHSLSNNVINAVLEDKDKKIWVGTDSGLNLLVNKKRTLFKSFLKDVKITALACAGKGIIWVGTNKGLMRLSKSGNVYKINLQRTFNKKINSIVENNINTLVTDQHNILWIGTSKAGLIKLNLSTGATQFYSTANKTLSSNSVRKLLLDKNGLLWIGTQKGINILNPLNGKVMVYQHDPDNIKSISQNSVYEIFADNHGSIWIGTYYGGANVVFPNLSAFEVFKSSNFKNSLSSNIISGIREDAEQNLWIGTEAEGLNLYHQQSKTFRTFKNNPANPNSLSSNLVKTIYIDQDKELWVGTFLGGLEKFNQSNQDFIHYKNKQGVKGTISSNNVYCMLHDSQRRFWVGTTRGLNLLDKKNIKFSQPDASKGNNSAICKSIIRCIHEDRQKNIWVGAIGGLYFLKYKSDAFTRLNFSNSPNCITEDESGNIWIGFYYGGITCYNPETKKLENWRMKNGLPNDNILGILTEKPGILWLSTDKGISRFDTKKKTFKNYNSNDGLPGNVFNENSYYKNKAGRMFFGGFSGLVSFFPAQFHQNHYAPAAIFTGIKLFNKTIAANSPYHIKKDSNGEQKITLRHDQNIFSVEFATLNYIKPGNNSYAYKLSGFEKDWNFVHIPSVTYTNLHEGKYVLLVKGRNNDGIWSKNVSKLQIEILPPLWRTWYAYLFYFVFFGSIIFIVLRYALMRELFKKEQEVHNLKLDFFTNISHEIRTPLTLITAPLEKMIYNASSDSGLSTQLHSIKDNADRLMRLTTELLDFRKAESGHMDLHISKNNIVSYSKQIFHVFQELATQNQIDYTFICQTEDIQLYFDHFQMEKVLFNLLSNAFKFSVNGGKISVFIEEFSDYVLIKVTDNGRGIPLEKQDRLFSSFYQIDSTKGQTGTGIGLALSKLIVELHSGTIQVNSQPVAANKEGSTTFSVKLKKGNTHFDRKTIVEPDPYEKLESGFVQPHPERVLQQSPDKNQHIESTILLIEDNPEIRKLLKDELFSRYHILECADGIQGLEMATAQIPDLIISDIMMPGIDGLELCEKVKLDDRTSHIPVILLTAKAAHAHQLAGLKTGADLYMTKPFSLELLAANIKNLIATRNLIRQKFGQIVTLEPTNVTIAAPDQAFLTKIMNYIEGQLANPNFNVPMLSVEMGMSQPILYKKIRALTDLSVNDFIKSVRLKKAAQLLNQRVYNVSETAYAVGFSDPKYFTKEFKKQFGLSPTDYVKSKKENLKEGSNPD